MVMERSTLHDVLATALGSEPHLADALVREVCPHATVGALGMAAYHVQEAHQAGRDWRWSDETEHVDAAYRALGAINPADARFDNSVCARERGLRDLYKIGTQKDPLLVAHLPPRDQVSRLTISAMWAGPTSQQPPMMVAPISAHSSVNSA